MIITRISRLFRADIHHLLDCIEEPEVLLKQAIREMESEIEKDLVELEKGNALKKKLIQEQEERAAEIVEMSEKTKRAFSAGEEGLAKTFVKRKLAATKRQLRIERDLVKIDETLTEQEKRVSERKTKLDEIREKAKLYKAVSGKESAKSAMPSAVENMATLTDEEIELAFVEARKEFEQAGA